METPFGQHLLIELTAQDGLDDQTRIEAALKDAATACGATVLQVHSHRFTPHGVTGVALLAESHITVHSWPEHGYAAFDIFLCGDADPMRAVEVLERAFDGKATSRRLLPRGPQPLGGIE